MPFTKVNKLYINVGSLEARIWPGKVYDYDSSSRSNDKSLPHSKYYTLEIETDFRKAIYTIRGQNSEKRVDPSADEATHGDRNNPLVWVKCKSFDKYGIFYQDGLRSYYDFDHE